MPGVISSIGKPIFEKSRVKWSVGFALGFLATLCGGVCVTAISWAQPKPSCRCWLSRQPASLASLEGRAPCGTHGAAPPLGPGPAGFRFSPVQTRALSAGAAALLTHPPPPLSPAPRPAPAHCLLPLGVAPVFGCPRGAGGRAALGQRPWPWAGAAGRPCWGCWRWVRVSFSLTRCACVHARAHAHTHVRTHTRTCTSACVCGGGVLAVCFRGPPAASGTSAHPPLALRSPGSRAALRGPETPTLGRAARGDHLRAAGGLEGAGTVAEAECCRRAQVFHMEM